ncbi:FIG001592: Phosphocarrier protein kinase/phosphorylase, nitrogen regulation associated [hydrothermal vent metagenome]|uniref:phosphoenolpyruvate--protein phosphotransferase n=1 Tax=hydrothermal vent metagenome TaxID=652676 RepID=A0A3B1AUI8_9ZZZZ
MQIICGKIVVDWLDMLEILHHIVKKVNAAPNLNKALNIIVKRVQQAIDTDVCSVYLTDFETREHVLQATVGLSADAVGKVQILMHRGLVGLVCERAEPINVEDAPAHPRYIAINGIDEERYHGFLGVPIIQNRQVLGVLVVQQEAPRQYEDDEVTFLFTLAAQLAGAITQAKVSGELASYQAQEGAPISFLKGRPGSSGIAFGSVVVSYRLSDLGAIPDREAADPELEENAFRAAVAAVTGDLKALKQRVGDTLPEEDQALFDAWILMLGSDSLVDRGVERIHQGHWAAGALRQTVHEHAQMFDDMDDVYMRERASDIRDLGRRILAYLQCDTAKVSVYPENTILVGEDVSAVQLAEVPRDKLVGVISATGSSSSHVAILARAMNIPTVMGVAELPVGRMDGREVIIDGYKGRIYVSPPPSVQEEYRRLADEDRQLSAELEALRSLPAETMDGVCIPLYMNTGLVSEMDSLGMEEAAGVGLYRTELPFMVRDRFPSEKEQVANYRRIINAFAPRPVTLRTLDIGGDKPLPYFPVEEANPFLGWRGVRISLDHPEIFLTQLRAMLLAAVGFDNLRIMIPMISRVEEVDDAQLLIQRAYAELVEEGFNVSMPKIGVMIEVPSAIYQVEALARRVDFLSIGSNDLTQYLLAVDRNNPQVADIYDDMHPAVLRALTQVVAGAKVHDCPVSVCGELAGNPAAAVLLLGMGVDSLSMSGGALLRVKGVLRRISYTRSQELLQQALNYEGAAAVRQLMYNTLEDMGLGGLMRPGK